MAQIKDYQVIILKNIKTIRKKNNLSQKQFSQLINVPPSSIAGYEVQSREVPLDVIMKICETFNISIDVFTKTDISLPRPENLSGEIEMRGKTVENNGLVFIGLPIDTATYDHFRKILPKLGKLAGLDEMFEKTTIKGVIKTNIQVKKYELISTHTARRSFATNAYLSGVPTFLIMSILGMKTEAVLMKYINISAEELAENSKNHKFFLQ